MNNESQAERASRERRRTVFDAAAERYETTRSGYPEGLVSRLVETSGVSVGSRVLEIGCGTGQLTRQLVGFGVALTAIDPAPLMIAAAERHPDLRAVQFDVATFEEYRAGDDLFQLLVSATAFHWVDPAVRWTKSAELLHPGGWLALLITREEYDDPVRSGLRDLYVRNTDGPATWADPLPPEEQARMDGSDDICERWSGKPGASRGLFGSALEWLESSRHRVSAEFVVNLELTRATTLSYEPSRREAFVRDLRAILSPFPSIALTQVSRLVMAPVL